MPTGSLGSGHTLPELHLIELSGPLQSRTLKHVRLGRPVSPGEVSTRLHLDDEGLSSDQHIAN